MVPELCEHRYVWELLASSRWDKKSVKSQADKNIQANTPEKSSDLWLTKAEILGGEELDEGSQKILRMSNYKIDKS